MSMTKPTRDLRLDLVRGVVMLIIFIAHVPGNSWEQFIPARFGFSSAAEVFVFCSGYATALAFGDDEEDRLFHAVGPEDFFGAAP